MSKKQLKEISEFFKKEKTYGSFLEHDLKKKNFPALLPISYALENISNVSGISYLLKDISKHTMHTESYKNTQKRCADENELAVLDSALLLYEKFRFSLLDLES